MPTKADLIYKDPSTNADKWWSATVDGETLTVSFGRAGTTGQIRVKNLKSHGAACEQFDKVLTEKLTKGYVWSDQPSQAIQPGVVAPTRAVSVPEVRPMLAEEIKSDLGKALEKYAADDNYVFQGKVDGHRVMLHIGDDGALTVLGRGGQNSQHAPRFAQATYARHLAQLPAGTVLDGELVGDIFWLFDLPLHAGEGAVPKVIDLDSPYSDRLAALEDLFDAWRPSSWFRLLPTAHDKVTKLELAAKWLKAGGEGVMVKDIRGEYQPGKRVGTVLKAKFVRSADCVVTGVGVGGKDNYELGLYRDGKLVVVGQCSSIGKDAAKVGDVIEVRFLNVGGDNRLYQPRMIGNVRRDKTAAECVFSQLDGCQVNRTVIL